jgi:hypothetical protein
MRNNQSITNPEVPLMSKFKGFAVIAVSLVFILFTNVASAVEIGPLQAGAAKVDITPDANQIPGPYTSNLVNGHERAVLLNADIGVMSSDICDSASKEISKQLNVPLANILISATHDHSAIFGEGPGSADLPAVKAFREKLGGGMVEAATQAKARVQPARIGYGKGNLYLNVNRDAIDEQTRLWAQEPNLNYPSDKTLAVVKIESLSGELIAVYMNYAMHAISLFLDGKVSGDFPGEAARYIEHMHGDKAVVL